MESKIVVNREAKDQGIYINRISLSPSESADFNSDEDYFYYVISGYGLLSIEDYGYSIEPELGVYVPTGSNYKLTNTGDVSLDLVYFGVKHNV